MGKTSRTKNSVINFVTGFGGYLITVFLHFFVRTVFIHTLGKEYLGINGLFSNILSVLSLAELGIGAAIVYRLYKPLAEKDARRVRILLKFYRFAYRCIGLVILILGLLLIPFLPALIKDYESLASLGINAVLLFLLFLANSVSSYLFLAYRSTIVIADQKRYIVDLVNNSMQIARTILQIIVLYLFKNFIIYTLVAVASSITSSLINGIIAKRLYPSYFQPEEESLSKAEIKEMLQDCGALFIYKINAVVVKASDNLVLSAFVGLATVGLYSNYLLLYRTFTTLINKVFIAFRASMGNLFATESVESKYRFFKISNFISAFLFGTAGVGVAVCGNEVIETWLDSGYVLAQPVPILIAIELFFAGIVVCLGQVRGVSGVFRQAWYRPLLGIIVNIVVSVVLVQFWGISGVIIGTITSYVFTNFLIEPALIYKYAFNNFRPLSEYYKANVMYLLVCAAVAAADLFICSRVFVGRGWFSVIVHILITGLSVPSAFLILFWKTEECRYLVDTALRVLRRVYHKYLANRG